MLGQLSCGVRLQGFFQPIAGEPYKHSSTGLPRQVELLHTAFSLADDPAAMAGISRCALSTSPRRRSRPRSHPDQPVIMLFMAELANLLMRASHTLARLRRHTCYCIGAAVTRWPLCNHGLSADAPQSDPNSACWASCLRGWLTRTAVVKSVVSRRLGACQGHNPHIMHRTQTVEMLAHGRGDEMLDTIFERYEAYARGHQLVLVEGTHEDGPIGEASVKPDQQYHLSGAPITIWCT